MINLEKSGVKNRIVYEGEMALGRVRIADALELLLGGEEKLLRARSIDSSG